MLPNKKTLTVIIALSMAAPVFAESTPPPWAAQVKPAAPAPAEPVSQPAQAPSAVPTTDNKASPWEAKSAPAPTNTSVPAPVTQPAMPVPSAMPAQITPPASSMTGFAAPSVNNDHDLSGLSADEIQFLSQQASVNRQYLTIQSLVKLQEQQNKFQELTIKNQAMIEESQNKKNPKKNEDDGKTDLQRRILNDVYLLSVYGEPGEMTADIYYRGGRQTVQEGDLIPTGEIVRSIEMNRMFVGKGKKKREIGMHSAELLNKNLGIK